MENFLYNVALHLWGIYGEEIGSLTILLPNNRSRIFFVDALSKIAGKPIFGPRFISIDSLMCDLAQIGRLDHIRTITELYHIYSQEHHEEFDSFYHWGEVLLSDFDAVDKYLIDADMLFTNLSDLKDMDGDLSYLSAEQVAAIRRFWESFDVEEEQSEHQKKFLTIWNSLLTIYNNFRSRLSDMGYGYAGMIYRRAAERLKAGEAELPEGEYAVVGFNALSAAEKVLFDHLQTAHQARFYWDYDDYYLKDDKQEAGLFVRENLARYPAPADFVLPSHFLSPKEINVISTASDSLQTKYAAEFIDDLLAKGVTPDKRTAIVLTNESLLSPLLYSLPSGPNPEEPIQYNVTMGFPLRSTLAYSFVERLLLLQQRVRVARSGAVSFYHSDVEGLLVHPFVVAADGDRALELRAKIIKQGRIYVATSEFEGCSPLVAQIFEPHNQWQTIQDYIGRIVAAVSQIEIVGETADKRGLRRECFGLIMEALTKSANSLGECASTVDMKFATYVALIRRVLQGVSIPYKGEPLSGVQVMGILETRNLDFDNVLLLSMNDDNFPSGRIREISFIPFNLRMAYGLPTPRHSEGVYAYYFYRLIQRARRVDMVYCSVADDATSGEQSRYIYQLDYESGHQIRRIEKVLGLNMAGQQEFVVEKSGVVADRLRGYLDGGGRVLSPSTFNNYMECPLKFYFKAIAGIKPDEEIEEDIDNSLFGTLFHRAMELLYGSLKDNEPHRVQIARMINTPEVHSAIVRAISEEYFNEKERLVAEEEYGGGLMMVRDTIEKYINDCVLPFDAARTDDYKVYKLEHPMKYDFPFGDHTVCFGGTSDRLDLMADGRIRVIDYKTGRPHNDIVGVKNLLSDDSKEHMGAALQTLLYSMMVEEAQKRGELKGCGATPSLYYVRHLNNVEYTPLLRFKGSGEEVKSFAPYADEFRTALAAQLALLFDTSVPFKATTDATACSYCDYAKLCRKK